MGLAKWRAPLALLVLWAIIRFRDLSSSLPSSSLSIHLITVPIEPTNRISTENSVNVHGLQMISDTNLTNDDVDEEKHVRDNGDASLLMLAPHEHRRENMTMGTDMEFRERGAAPTPAAVEALAISGITDAVPWEPSPCKLCSSENSYDWSEEGVSMRALGPIGHSMGGLGGARLCRFQQRLSAIAAAAIASVDLGAPILPLRIVVLGGSAPAGTFLSCDDGGTSATTGPTCAWPKRLEEVLNARAGLGGGKKAVVVLNLAKGGTTTFWAVNEFHRIPSDSNLVLVDFDVNDGAMLNDIPRGARPAGSSSSSSDEGLGLFPPQLASLRNSFVAASEVLLRRLLALDSKPAVVWVDSFAFDGRRKPATRGLAHGPDALSPELGNASCADVLGRGYSLPDARAHLAAAYGLPRLSLRDAFWPQLGCPPPYLGLSRSLWECSDTCHHPTAFTHRSIARLAADLIGRRAEAGWAAERGTVQGGGEGPARCASTAAGPTQGDWVSPGASAIEAVTCRDALTRVSAADASSNAALVHVGACWNRTEDRVGKAGWIAERCPDADGSGADGGLTLRLNFSAFLPRLSVTYLETYRGAGRVQVSVRRLGTGLTDVGDAPAQLLPSTDACAFVDAFKQETKHSQEVIKTFWFTRATGTSRIVAESALRGKEKCRLRQLDSATNHGHFLADVTFDFEKLSGSELLKRGGDKIKLTSISSC